MQIRVARTGLFRSSRETSAVLECIRTVDDVCKKWASLHANMERVKNAFPRTFGVLWIPDVLKVITHSIESIVEIEIAFLRCFYREVCVQNTDGVALVPDYYHFLG